MHSPESLQTGGISSNRKKNILFGENHVHPCTDAGPVCYCQQGVLVTCTSMDAYHVTARVQQPFSSRFFPNIISVSALTVSYTDKQLKWGIKLWSYQNQQPGPLTDARQVGERWDLLPSQTATEPAEDTGGLCPQVGRKLHLTGQGWGERERWKVRNQRRNLRMEVLYSQFKSYTIRDLRCTDSVMWSRSLSTADHPALSTHYNMSCLFPFLIP